MRDVDYVKLSEQYASFLIAIGGVSITVLSIVSTLGSPLTEEAQKKLAELDPNKLDPKLFLSAALIVATVCCFIGAHMMAETAAFINHFKEKLPKGQLAEARPPAESPSEVSSTEESSLEWTPAGAIIFGKRLFLFATTNIFIAVSLVLFSIVLLPSAKGDSAAISPIYTIIFVLVGIGTLIWMILASKFRMDVSRSWFAVAISLAVCLVWGFIFGYAIPVTRSGDGILPVTREGFLLPTFFPIVVMIVVSFIYFAWIFKDGNKAIKRRDSVLLVINDDDLIIKDGYKARRQEVCLKDLCFFGSAVTISYASLVVAGFRVGALNFNIW